MQAAASPTHKVRPKFLEFQQAYEQSLMSTKEGQGINASPSIKCSPSVLESEEKMVEAKGAAINVAKDIENSEEPTLIMPNHSATSDAQSNKIDSISQSFRSESKGITSQSCAHNEPSPDCNASSENGVSIA